MASISRLTIQMPRKIMRATMSETNLVAWPSYLTNY